MFPKPKTVDDVYEQAAGNPLVQVVIAVATVAGLALRGTVDAIWDTLVAKSWTWCILKIVSFLFNPQKYKIHWFIYLYVVQRRRHFHNLFRVILKFLSRDGADDDMIYFASMNGLISLVYGLEMLAFANLWTLYGYLKAWLPFFSVVIMTIFVVWTLSTYFFDMSALAPLMGLARMLLITWNLYQRIKLAVLRAVVAILLRTRPLFRTFYACKARLLNDKCSAYRGEAYLYLPLSETRSIRLLRVSRQGPFNDIDCEIIHVSLDQAPTYEAISYHWGNLSLDSDLMIQGKALQVTSRVVEIIESRASFLDTKLLWIDSVCINQKDLAEKGSQILLMKDIYTAAHRVLVWLGNAPDAGAAMDYLMEIKKKLLFNKDQGVHHIISSPFDPHQIALFKFLDHPWWTRAWIIQEVAVAKNVMVSYGIEYFSWSHLETFFYLVSRFVTGSVTSLTHVNVDFEVTLPAAVPQMALMTHIRDRYHSNNSSFTIGELLTFTKDCRASDPRDKIYAFLSLSNDSDNALLAPDYTKPVETVFCDTARYLCSQDVFSVLDFSGIGYPDNIQFLPSWVPDFSRDKINGLFHAQKTSPIYEAAYHASGSSTSSSCELHQSLPVLRASCLIFDCIAVLGPECIEFNPDRDVKRMAKKEVLRLSQMVDFVQEHISESSYPFTGQSCIEVVWRTRIGDRCQVNDQYQRPAPDTYGQYFEQILSHMNILKDQVEELEATNWSDEVVQTFPKPKVSHDIMIPFFQATSAAAHGKRTAITRQGAVCLVPLLARVGDVIGVMQGAQACMALRKEVKPVDPESNAPSSSNSDPISTEEDNWRHPQWRFVGHCYVHGFMDGEALDTGRSWEDKYIW